MSHRPRLLPVESPPFSATHSTSNISTTTSRIRNSQHVSYAISYPDLLLFAVPFEEQDLRGKHRRARTYNTSHEPQNETVQKVQRRLTAIEDGVECRISSCQAPVRLQNPFWTVDHISWLLRCRQGVVREEPGCASPAMPRTRFNRYNCSAAAHIWFGQEEKTQNFRAVSKACDRTQR